MYQLLLTQGTVIYQHDVSLDIWHIYLAFGFHYDTLCTIITKESTRWQLCQDFATLTWEYIYWKILLREVIGSCKLCAFVWRSSWDNICNVLVIPCLCFVCMHICIHCRYHYEGGHVVSSSHSAFAQHTLSLKQKSCQVCRRQVGIVS